MSENPVRRIDHTLVIPYRWSYGEALSRFFQESMKNKRLVGARCTSCKLVTVPCLTVCGLCFAPMEPDPVPVLDHGMLECWTTVRFSFPNQPAEPPYSVGLIHLDGADTYYQHLIGEIEPEQIRAGMRVEAVWNDQRKGTLRDILYFRPERKT